MQKVRTDYKTCPFCGANLDIGEKCDCQQEDFIVKAPKTQQRWNQSTRMVRYGTRMRS